MAAQICETCKYKDGKCYCAPNSTCEGYEPEEKEKIAEIIYDWLGRIYCDNCRYNNELRFDQCGDRPCGDCIRKSMGWEISMGAARSIAEDILNSEV